MKKLAIALTALALSATGIGTAIAAPNTAMTPKVMPSASIGDCSALGDHPEDWNTTPLADRLKTDGVNFSSIRTFGNCFNVAAIDSNGNPQIQLYDPTTLNRVM